jgi:thiol-disulfide isomerase/thioredoxin
MNRLTAPGTIMAGLAILGWAQRAAEPAALPQPAQPFAPFEQWKAAVVAGDAATVKGLYSTSPPARISAANSSSDSNAEGDFWVGFKAHKINFEIIQDVSSNADARVVIFEAEVFPVAQAEHPVYILEAQGWQHKSDQWWIVSVKRAGVAYLKQPLNKDKDLYPAGADARVEIKEAEEKAAKENKRVLLVFGANWCYDCHVLDLAFQRPDFKPVVARYEVVNVDIGADGKKNRDVANQYQVPVARGIPALAVLDGQGNLLVSQKNGEFENARAMTAEAMLEFLNKWKTEAR